MEERNFVSAKLNIKDHNLYTTKLSGYEAYREVEGDGNCMYTSIGVNLIEYMRDNISKWEPCIRTVKEMFIELNVEGFLYEDYIETLSEIIYSDKPIEDIEKYTWYEVIHFLRLVVSSEMKLNQEMYQPFICDMSVDEYCKKNVDPFYMESGYIEIGSLVCVLPFSIEVVDITEDSNEVSRIYGTNKEKVSILHTHNHFEVLY